MTEPDRWAVDVLNDALYEMRLPYADANAAALTIQAAFAEREARLIKALECAFRAADVILAPICASSGRYIHEPSRCDDMIRELASEGVVLSAQMFADLYEATHPDILTAIKEPIT